MRAAAGGGFSTATDLADWLVRALGLPFRDAHHVTGRIVAAAEAQGVAAGGAASGGHAGGRAAHHRGVFSVLSVRELRQEPRKLWWNRATERAENGPGLDKAVGKAAGKGLRYLALWPDGSKCRMVLGASRRADGSPAYEFNGVTEPHMLSRLPLWLLMASTALACLSVLGCGVRGPLEAPPASSRAPPPTKPGEPADRAAHNCPSILLTR